MKFDFAKYTGVYSSHAGRFKLLISRDAVKGERDTFKVRFLLQIEEQAPALAMHTPGVHFGISLLSWFSLVILYCHGVFFHLHHLFNNRGSCC